MPGDSLGRDRPANPGSRVVALERNGQTVQAQDVTVVRGQTATVQLDTPLASDESGGGAVFEDWRLWAIVTGAVVVTAVVTALVVGDGGSSSSPAPGTRTPLSIQF